MKLLFFAAFLSVMQATPPIPRKATDNPDRASQNVTKNAKGNKTPAAPAQSDINPVAADPRQSPSQPPKPVDTPQTIRIPEPISMSVSKDWIDKLSITLTGILVIVGALGVKAAFRTLKAIEHQTQVQWATTRAQIVAESHGNAAQDMLSDISRVQLDITNSGGTPAYDVRYESWIELCPEPFTDFTSAATYFKTADKRTIYPRIPVLFNIPLGRSLAGTERQHLLNLRLKACVRLRVEYRDARKESRYAEFGFTVMKEGLGFLPKYQDSN